MQALEYGVDVKMITGDQAIIAKEMSRMLGLGENIRGTDGLPTMDAHGTVGDRAVGCSVCVYAHCCCNGMTPSYVSDAWPPQIPTDLGEKYGKMILEADGFAHVFPEHKVGVLLSKT
jgi:H+-transporting ATPase